MWRNDWSGERAAVTVKSDSMAALGAATKLRSTSPAINAVVRELALDLAEGKYRIDFFEHLPGAENMLADELSRLYQPGAVATVPTALGDVPRVHPPPRGPGWWETDAYPSGVGGAELSG